MNHKSFVFFDCECANTFDGVGKICSIGYVITDDDLNVIESEDVVINPECEFDWYLFSGKGECKLAYSKDYFRIKPNFEAYYKDIKNVKFHIKDFYGEVDSVASIGGLSLKDVNASFESKRENYKYMGAFQAGVNLFTVLIQICVILTGTILIANKSLEISDLITFLLYIFWIVP